MNIVTVKGARCPCALCGVTDMCLPVGKDLSLICIDCARLPENLPYMMEAIKGWVKDHLDLQEIKESQLN